MLPLTEGRWCRFVEHTVDRCRGEHYMVVGGRTIWPGHGQVVIRLPRFQREARWFCGSEKERVAWGSAANELRVNFWTDGRVAWNVFFCYN